MQLKLPSRLTITDCENRLSWFVEEEYDYYDGIPSSDPNHISPEDVIVTTAINSNLNAKKIRRVHREISEKCDPILAKIPVDAQLISDDLDEQTIEDLFREACSVYGALMSVATKILHRKRRELIPILDNGVMEHYVGKTRVDSQDGGSASVMGMECLQLFRRDLKATWNDLQGILAGNNFGISKVRALEALIWMEVTGSYRT